MFGDFKGSFPSKFRRRGISLKCVLCENMFGRNSALDNTSETNMESQRHFIEICPNVRDLREQFDTESDIGIIEFFKAVLLRKELLDDS